MGKMANLRVAVVEIQRSDIRDGPGAVHGTQEAFPGMILSL